MTPPRPPRRPVPGALVLIGLIGMAACDGAVARQAFAPPDTAAAPALPDSAFASMVERLSGPAGYFDTDNLISNESSYLHVLGPLRERGVRGGAYLGVGPDQNFSYVAEVRPRLAFIVDIRRDNVLQHLLFKALFELSATRADYLAHWVGVAPPDDPAEWVDRPVEALVARTDSLWPDPAWAERARARVDSAVATYGVPLSDDDRATVRRFHDEFISRGLGLRFRSHGRRPRPYYPTLRRLLLETDLTGEAGSYLASEEDYRFLRGLQLANRVVPVVGDLAGEHALAAVAEELRRRGERVTALYTSNVEFYLWRGGTFPAFARNVAGLPWAEGGVILRSYFPNFGRHPHAVPGFYSTQTLQPAERFLAAVEEGGFSSYTDLVTRDAVDPRVPSPAGAGGPSPP